MLIGIGLPFVACLLLLTIICKKWLFYKKYLLSDHLIKYTKRSEQQLDDAAGLLGDFVGLVGEKTVEGRLDPGLAADEPGDGDEIGSEMIAMHLDAHRQGFTRHDHPGDDRFGFFVDFDLLDRTDALEIGIDKGFDGCCFKPLEHCDVPPVIGMWLATRRRTTIWAPGHADPRRCAAG